jgi:hypothetical protein
MQSRLDLTKRILPLGCIGRHSFIGLDGVPATDFCRTPQEPWTTPGAIDLDGNRLVPDP